MMTTTTTTHSYFMMVLYNTVVNQKPHINLFRIFDKIFTSKFFWSFIGDARTPVHSSLKNIEMPLDWKLL